MYFKNEGKIKTFVQKTNVKYIISICLIKKDEIFQDEKNDIRWKCILTLTIKTKENESLGCCAWMLHELQRSKGTQDQSTWRYQGLLNGGTSWEVIVLLGACSSRELCDPGIDFFLLQFGLSPSLACVPVLVPPYSPAPPH